MDVGHYRADLVILSGARGSGKTSLCTLLVENARKAGWQVGGLLTPAVFEAGQKKSIDVLDLNTGVRHRLAKLRRAGDTGVQTPHWNFDTLALEWGNQVLQASVPCDLLVIDELGPLELLQGQGWTAAFDVLSSGSYHLAVTVIRPELLEIACSRWPQGRLISINSSHEAASLAVQICSDYGMI